MTDLDADEFFKQMEADRLAWWEEREKLRRRATELALRALVGEDASKASVQWKDEHKGPSSFDRTRSVTIFTPLMTITIQAPIKEFE